MKQVAGTLRLDLAQYRELAAFAQFGSDMDQATRNALAHGSRMMELLKQDQYAPLAVAEQVAVLFAGVRGHLADVDVHDVVDWGNGLVDYLRTSAVDVLAEINDKKKLDEELEAKITAAINAYKASIS